MERDVYLGRLKLHGSEHQATLAAASNYADSLHNLKRFDASRRRDAVRMGVRLGRMFRRTSSIHHSTRRAAKRVDW